MNPMDFSLKTSRSRTTVFANFLPKFFRLPVHGLIGNGKFSLIARTEFLSNVQKDNYLSLSNGKSNYMQDLSSYNLLRIQLRRVMLHEVVKLYCISVKALVVNYQLLLKRHRV